jgi:putative transposon-encoded protein
MNKNDNNKKTTFRLNTEEMKKLQVIIEHYFGKTVKKMGLSSIRMLIEKEYIKITKEK